jgi:hypothetical protein
VTTITDFGKRTILFLYSTAALILALSSPAHALSDVSGFRPRPEAIGVLAQEKVTTVAFCEMVKHPEFYFDKSVRLTARLELAEEAQYLVDDKCPLSQDEQIGVRYVNLSAQERNLTNKEITQIRSMEFGSQASVTVVGMLRNSSMRAFAWYHYGFDINRFEEISPVIVPYEGTLQAGFTYRAAVRGDKRFRLSLAIPLRVPEYYAVRIEWTNVNKFPALKRLQSSRREREIVFSVISDQSKQMTERRWNRTILCKVISVE